MTPLEHPEDPEQSEQEKPPFVVGLLAESDLPLKVLDRLAAQLPGVLADRVDAGRSWQVRVVRETLAIDEDGNLPLSPHAEALRERYSCDQLVYLTDLPRIVGERPLVAEIKSGGEAAIISVPALGPWLGRRLRQVIPRVVEELYHRGRQDSYGPRHGAAGMVNPVADVPHPDPMVDSVITLPRVRGYPRLLLGLVRANRPWQLVSALSGAMATSAATGAFGIFYASIWGMANALSVARLAGISMLAILALAVWLVLSNGLWERREGRRKSVVYNISTLVSVVVAVTLMYLGLFGLLLVGAVSIIARDYLEAQIGEPAGFGSYVYLAWLATSLGAFAGAIGSRWDDPDRVRQATFGRREYQRRYQSSGWELGERP